MKKSLLLLAFLFLPFSAFAWVDTDRICADDAKWGKSDDGINISYPWEKISVRTVFKIAYSQEKMPVYDENTRNRLYYMVNIREQKIDSSKNTRSELYEYDCQSKTPKLLLMLKIAENGESYYTIDYHNKWNLILAQKFFWMADGGTEKIVWYNIYQKKKLFDIKWNKKEGSVDWFANSKNSWYLYFTSTDFIGEGMIYRIDKQSQKITKL